jgi:predicted ATPase
VLNRLGRLEGMKLVGSIAGNALADEVVADIVERTDGVPLFVEEVTKAVVEAGSRDESATEALLTTPLPALGVPATLHASLIARLDRLGPVAKKIAQIGAVIGREFDYELLDAVARRPEAELKAALDRLTGAELVFQRDAMPRATFLFKHALVRDTAYGSLLRGQRRDLHARISEELESTFPEIGERQPEVLARHLTEAGHTEHAIEQWLKAGQHAAGRSAHLEAIAHLTGVWNCCVRHRIGPAAYRWKAICNLRSAFRSFPPRGCRARKLPAPMSVRENCAKTAATARACSRRCGVCGTRTTAAPVWISHTAYACGS